MDIQETTSYRLKRENSCKASRHIESAQKEVISKEYQPTYFDPGKVEVEEPEQIKMEIEKENENEKASRNSTET